MAFDDRPSHSRLERGSKSDHGQPRMTIDEGSKIFREIILKEKEKQSGKHNAIPKSTESSNKTGNAVMRSGPPGVPPHLWSTLGTSTVNSSTGNIDTGSAISTGKVAFDPGLDNTASLSHLQASVNDAGSRKHNPLREHTEVSPTSSPEGGVRLSVASSDGQDTPAARAVDSSMYSPPVPYPQLAASRHALPTDTLSPASKAPIHRWRNVLAGLNGSTPCNPGIIAPPRRSNRPELGRSLPIPKTKAPVARPQQLTESSRRISADGSVSSYHVSNDGIELTALRAADSSKDIRGEIGKELDIVPYNCKWVNTSWNDGYDDNSETESAGFIHRFIKEWVKGTPDNVCPTFLRRDVFEHFRCDVNTETGNLLEPVDQPYTGPAPMEENDLVWRHQNMTSNLIMRRSRGALLKKQKRDEAREKEEQCRTPPAGMVPVVRTQPAVVETDPRTPKVVVHIRPADQGDMAGCLKIYNWEVEEGFQAIDAWTLKLEEFHSILNKCQSLRTPFIVAIKGSSNDSRLRKEGAAIAASGHPPRSPSPNRASVDTVVAFGFTSLCDPGLAGDTRSNTGRLCGKLHVYVDCSYRQKGIGRALFDRLVAICSDMVSPMDCVEWLDPGRDNLVYQNGSSHIRPYMCLFVDVFYEDGNDKNIAWYEKQLKQYQFDRVCLLEKNHWTRACPSYLPKNKATYMHDCRYLTGPRELQEPRTPADNALDGGWV